MKKPFALLTTVLLLLAAFPAVTVGAVPPPRTYRHDLMISSYRPTIDGKVFSDEWGAPRFTFRGSNPKESDGKLRQTDEENPLVPEEINGYFGWDSENLYIAVTVTDPVHSNNAHNKLDIHKGDSLMLRIQPYAGGPEYIWGFTYSTFGPKVRMAYQWSPQPIELPNGKRNSYFYADLSETGQPVTTYELAIPAAMLGRERFTTGDILPISVVLHLTDDADPEHTVTPSGAYYEWGVGLFDSSETDERCELHLTDGSKVEGDFCYQLSADGVTLTKYLGSDREVTIPDQFEGQPVTGIAAGAFAGCETVSDIRWPETVRQIERDAFAGTAFEQRLAAMPEGPVYVGRMLCRYNLLPNSALGFDHLLMLREDTIGIADGIFTGAPGGMTVFAPEQTRCIGDNPEIAWYLLPDTPAAAYADANGIDYTPVSRISNADGTVQAVIENRGEQFTELRTTVLATSEEDAFLNMQLGEKSVLYAFDPVTADGEIVRDRGGYLLVPPPQESSLYVYQQAQNGDFQHLLSEVQNGTVVWKLYRFGVYALSALPPDAYRFIRGDVDGDGWINTTDARLTLQFAVDKLSLSEKEQAFADVNGDGNVDTTDARLILQYAVGKIDSFPAGR